MTKCSLLVKTNDTSHFIHPFSIPGYICCISIFLYTSMYINMNEMISQKTRLISKLFNFFKVSFVSLHVSPLFSRLESRYRTSPHATIITTRLSRIEKRKNLFYFFILCGLIVPSQDSKSIRSSMHSYRRL